MTEQIILKDRQVAKLPDITNGKVAYQYKGTAEVRLAHLVFGLVRHPSIGKWLARFAQWTLRFRLPLQPFIRHTAFRVFCAGEDREEAFQTIKKLKTFNVKSVLDYVSESEESAAAFAKNTETIIESIRKLSANAQGNYISLKLSGLEESGLLGRASAGRDRLTEVEKERLSVFQERVDRICSVAEASDVAVFIDAEDRYMQDLFDETAEAMMEKHNRSKAIVYNTLQMYLKDRRAYLGKLIRHAESAGFRAGIKLVRGAYVEKERERAARNGLESPVFDTKEETDRSFNDAVEMCVKNHRTVYTCIATHNEKSILHAVECIQKYNVNDYARKVKFSQLYGMGDLLTFNLANAGFDASKYLPYGELSKALPYLIRRAEENGSVQGQMNRELSALKNELKRRKEC